jgi:hypothetical protein
MSQDLVFVWTRIVGYACRWVLFGLCVVISACSDEDGATDPSSGVRRDTADASQDTTMAILRTPLMYCARNYNPYIEVRDTFTITGRDFSATRPFKIWLVRVDGTSRDTLRLFDNDSVKTAFWFNQSMISTMRWIPKGRYRAEIVDARTHRRMAKVTPDLEVRSLQLRPMERTSFESGDQISLTTVFPWAFDLPYNVDAYLKRYITVWLGDRQLKVDTKIDMTNPYPEHTSFYWLSAAASFSGTGQIKVRDSFLNEEALGPNITIADVPYTRYFAYGEVTWDKVMTWRYTDTVRYLETIVSGKDSTYTQRDTFRVRLRRGCCDTVTRGDTTRFTNGRDTNGFTQSVIIIDADASICRWITMEYVHSTSYSSNKESSNGRTTRSIILRDVPATVLADGSWSIDLDRAAFMRHLVSLDFSGWNSSTHVDYSNRFNQLVGTLTDSDPMRFRLLLSAR